MLLDHNISYLMKLLNVFVANFILYYDFRFLDIKIYAICDILNEINFICYLIYFVESNCIKSGDRTYCIKFMYYV